MASAARQGLVLLEVARSPNWPPEYVYHHGSKQFYCLTKRIRNTYTNTADLVLLLGKCQDGELMEEMEYAQGEQTWSSPDRFDLRAREKGSSFSLW